MPLFWKVQIITDESIQMRYCTLLQDNREGGAKVKFFSRFFDELISFKIGHRYISSSYLIDFDRVYGILYLFHYILPKCILSHSLS